MNATAIAGRRREIPNELDTIVATKSMNTAQKSAALDAIKAEVQRLDAASEYVGKSYEFASLSDPSAVSTKSTESPSLALSAEATEVLFKSAQTGQPVVVKTVGTGNVDPATSPTSIYPPILLAREPRRVLDLLPSTASTAGVVEYFTTTGTANAGVVAEGAQKPESAIAFTRVHATPTNVAHFITVTEEALADYSAFQSIATADLIAGVIDVESNILLNGIACTPAAQTFNGLLKAAGTQTYTRATGDTVLDAIEIASTGLRASGRYADADGIVMHPVDFSKARRTKSTTGEYLAGNPTQAGSATLWGLPVAIISKMPHGKALVGAFRQAAMVWVRDGISVRVDPYSQSASNKVLLIAEERLTLGVTVPSALSVVTISDPT